jgi:hypothetical protein
MTKRLQHGAASKSPKRRPNDEEEELDVPAELDFLNDCQQQLNKSNKELWTILTKKHESIHGLRRLPQFAGTKDEDFLTWFEDFKLTSERTCSSEEERLIIFKTYLTGDARHVYEGFNGNEIQTLEEAGKMMNAVFAVARDRQEWILHLRELKKKESENIRVFAYRTARIVRQAFPEADEDTYNFLAIDYFTRGLPEMINSYVIIRKPKSLDLAIQYADIAEKQDSPKMKTDTINLRHQIANTINQGDIEPYKNDTNNRFKQVTEEIRTLKTKNQELQHTLNVMQQTQQEFGMMKKTNETEKRDITQSDKFDEILSTIQHMETQLRKPYFQNKQHDNEYQNPKRCYNCGKTGHLAQQCFNKDNRSCYSCGKNGHVSRDCYTNKNKRNNIKSSLKDNGVSSRSRN